MNPKEAASSLFCTYSKHLLAGGTCFLLIGIGLLMWAAPRFTVDLTAAVLAGVGVVLFFGGEIALIQCMRTWNSDQASPSPVGSAS